MATMDSGIGERVIEALGPEATLEELVKAMTQDEYEECMQYIARMYDIPPTDEELEDMAREEEARRIASGYKDPEQTLEWAESQDL